MQEDRVEGEPRNREKSIQVNARLPCLSAPWLGRLGVRLGVVGCGLFSQVSSLLPVLGVFWCVWCGVRDGGAIELKLGSWELWELGPPPSRSSDKVRRQEQRSDT